MNAMPGPSPFSVLCVSLLMTTWCTAAAAAADNDDANAAVNAKLQRAVPELKFDGVGFADTLDFLKDVSGVTVEADWAALEKAGVSKNAPVTATIKNATLAQALTALLDKAARKPGQLSFTVKGGKILVAPTGK